MEKLQAALEKARNKRVSATRSVSSRNQVVSNPKAGRLDQLWSGIPEIEISGEALSEHNVVTRQASQKATPFDILRTKILLQMRENNWRSLAITSPMPKSGKTTMSCNLALGLGRQGGLRTMLFDLDLQDPSVASFLGHKPMVHISDMLSGEVPYAEQAVRVGDSVAVSMAARRENDPTRVLLSEKTRETLENVQKTYAPDIVIYDMPSILVSDNTRAFLKNADCALIVARANETKYNHFDDCEREVAEYTNVLGTVLNACRTKNISDETV